MHPFGFKDFWIQRLQQVGPLVGSITELPKMQRLESRFGSVGVAQDETALVGQRKKTYFTSSDPHHGIQGNILSSLPSSKV